MSTQAIVALAMLSGAVLLVTGLLEPVERRPFLRTTTTRFAVAAAGTKATAQQT